MSYALINADDSWASGPLDAEPAPGDGQRVVEVALGYPTTCLWSQVKGGFVDLVVASPLISVGRFKTLFTFQERTAMRAAAAQSPQIEDFLDLLSGFTDGVSLSDPLLIGAIGQLQAGGLLTPARAAAILAGNPPQ